MSVINRYDSMAHRLSGGFGNDANIASADGEVTIFEGSIGGFASLIWIGSCDQNLTIRVWQGASQGLYDVVDVGTITGDVSNGGKPAAGTGSAKTVAVVAPLGKVTAQAASDTAHIHFEVGCRKI